MQPIRILHVVAIMNMGGIENFLMNIYRNLNRELIQFDFLVTRNEIGYFDDEILKLGGQIFNIETMEKQGIKKYKSNIKSFLMKHNYKIIHVHRDALSSIYLEQARFAGIPIRIAHSHSTGYGESYSLRGYAKAKIKAYYKSKIIKNATNFYACSLEAGKWLFGNNHDFKIIKNGIKLDPYEYSNISNLTLRHLLGIRDNTFVIGNVARFSEDKNHKFLIEQFSDFQVDKSDVLLVLVGRGKLENIVKQEVKKHKIESKVLFLGIREDIPDLMMIFDLFVFPSLHEGLGIVLIEAQATGLNCVTTKAVPKEVDQGCGLVVFEDLKQPTNFLNRMNEAYFKYYAMRKSRVSNLKKLKENGYDISSTVDILSNFYLRCGEYNE